MSRPAGSYPRQNVRLHSISGPLCQGSTTTVAGFHTCGTQLPPASWMRLPVLFIDHHHKPICLTKSLPVAKPSPNVYCCYSPIILADLRPSFAPSQRNVYSRPFFCCKTSVYGGLSWRDSTLQKNHDSITVFIPAVWSWTSPNLTPRILSIQPTTSNCWSEPYNISGRQPNPVVLITLRRFCLASTFHGWAICYFTIWLVLLEQWQQLGIFKWRREGSKRNSGQHLW